MKRAHWAWCFLAVLSVKAGAQPPTVSFSVTDRPLREVLTALSQQTGYTFVPIGDAGDRTVSAQWDKVPLPEALRRLRALVRCAFLRSQRTYFVVPLLDADALRQRLAQAPSPNTLAATVVFAERTGWGWRPVTAHLQFQAPDRFTLELPQARIWSEAERVMAWDKQRGVVTEAASPLRDWTNAMLGVVAVPNFGHGWTHLSDWQPTEVTATVLKNRPVWVLELTRKGTPPPQITFSLLRVTLSNTLYAPYIEPAPVAWRVRCFVDCQTLNAVRREVYDPNGRPLLVVAAELASPNRPLWAIPHRFEVLDAGLTPVGRGEWQPAESGAAEPATPLPADVLRPEHPIARRLQQAEQVWLSRDDAATALRLLGEAVADTQHPAAMASAAALYARLNRPDAAWRCLQKMQAHLWRFPEAVALALQLADALRRWSELQAWLQAQSDRPSPAVWMALAQLATLQAWQQWSAGREVSDERAEAPTVWWERVLRHVAAHPDDPGDRATAWTAAQRLFVWAWATDQLAKATDIAQGLLNTPAAPLGHALLAWAAMERNDADTARRHLRAVQEQFADWTALRLDLAELAETYGLTDEADSEYRRLATETAMTPEGWRSREHWLRRLVENDRAEEAVRLFLDSVALVRTDWAKSQWAETFRETATTALRHNRVAGTAQKWWEHKVAHPDAVWLYDLMARFSESEAQWDEALNWLHRATTAFLRQPIFAARWCQVVLRLHEVAQRGAPDPNAAKRLRQLALKRLAWMDERLRSWHRQFAGQPFFAWLFIFTPNLLAAYEENPAGIRRQVREFLRRAKEVMPASAPAERQLLETLTLLNNPANWLDRPSDIRRALLQLQQVTGAQWHGLRNLARQLFAAFNGVQPDLNLFLPFLDEAIDGCWDDVERIAVAQNALQALVQRQLWREALSRLHRWLQLPGSDLYRRSLMLGWRSVIAPLVTEEKGQMAVMQQLTLLPDDAAGWVLRAEAFEVMGGTDKAKAAYERAVAQSDADWVWQLYGEAALRWNDVPTAQQALAKALRAAPSAERALFWLQVRTQGDQQVDATTLQRMVACFGWHWRLLAALAGVVNDPAEAFRWGQVAERLATMDAGASREQKFWLRVHLARLAGQAGHRALAQFWLERLRHPEAPESIRTAADEVARQLP